MELIDWRFRKYPNESWRWLGRILYKYARGVFCRYQGARVRRARRFRWGTENPHFPISGFTVSGRPIPRRYIWD